MNKKQLFATAMSAVLLFNSTPTSALAAELNAQQPAAVTAGLAGSPGRSGEGHGFAG